MINYFTIKHCYTFVRWANFFESVGPNKTIIGVLANAIICIIPLSIDIAVSSLEDNAVTRAGQDNLELSSENKLRVPGF